MTATGIEHYDTASAFIKSMRGSDADAALYWMAKMIYAGEDPRFIARRIVICAAEDVGNADPQALILANAALQAAEFTGLPEARIILAQAAVYVACAPKSNAVYLAIDKALADVKEARTQGVPVHLKVGTILGRVNWGMARDINTRMIIRNIMSSKNICRIKLFIMSRLCRAMRPRLKREWTNLRKNDNIHKT